MEKDASEGWDAIADRFVSTRSSIGTALVCGWAGQHLPAGATILDVGCGSGVPISKALANDGFQLFGVDASPALIREFRRELPTATSACEAAQTSSFFHRNFDAAIAVGLLFLLSGDDQRRVLERIAGVLHDGARFLFSAPREACEWRDLLTGRTSLSLGLDEYARVLAEANMQLVDRHVDEGGNHYYDAAKQAGGGKARPLPAAALPAPAPRR